MRRGHTWPCKHLGIMEFRVPATPGSSTLLLAFSLPWLGPCERRVTAVLDILTSYLHPHLQPPSSLPSSPPSSRHPHPILTSIQPPSSPPSSPASPPSSPHHPRQTLLATPSLPHHPRQNSILATPTSPELHPRHTILARPSSPHQSRHTILSIPATPSSPSSPASPPSSPPSSRHPHGGGIANSPGIRRLPHADTQTGRLQQRGGTTPQSTHTGHLRSGP